MPDAFTIHDSDADSLKSKDSEDEAQHLLAEDREEPGLGEEVNSPGTMQRLYSSDRTAKIPAHATQMELDADAGGESSNALALTESRRSAAPSQDAREEEQVQYRVYKRRWFGLIQLILLNIIVSWDWLTFAALSETSAEYFGVSESAINWLSTAFLFAFVLVTPVVIWALNRGPKLAIMVSSVLVFVGNWIRYAGTAGRSSANGRYGVVMFGQILIGFAQPFVLAAPTRYSDLWFTDKGRISATAVASLANPFGGAIGQLVGPLMADKASDVDRLILYVAVISTVASIPSFFIPSRPPTPPSPSSAIPRLPLHQTFSSLIRNPSFWLLFIPFSIYVGFFNSISSLFNQILSPYGFTEEAAGIAGALLIVVGLVTAAVTSPIVDKTKRYLLFIKVLVPLIAISYTLWIPAPRTRTYAMPYAVSALLGASSFSLVPIALEYLVEVTFPISPEIGSTICWAGGQLCGGLFILISDALRGGAKGEPEGSMQRALIFQAVVAWAAVPLPLCLGLFGLGKGRQRLDVDKGVGVIRV